MILSIVGLDIGYGRKIVQRSLNLQAGSGRLICLVGRNGYGKSTLLRTIAGLQPPLAGEILIDGQDVTKMSDGKRSLLMSLVLTDRIDVDNMTVSDLVALGRYPYTSWNGSLSPEDKDMVADAMRRVNIFHQKDSQSFGTGYAACTTRRAHIAPRPIESYRYYVSTQRLVAYDEEDLRTLYARTRFGYRYGGLYLAYAAKRRNDRYPRRPFTRRYVSAIACKRQFRLRHRRRSLPNHTTARHTERRNSR